MMHPYRVKELFWVAIIALFVIIAIVGCSSTPTVAAVKPQYCYTSQTIETENRETVNSRTVVECTDDQIKRLAAPRIGLAKNCGEFLYWTTIGGVNVQRQGISCQKLDGSWEIVNGAR